MNRRSFLKTGVAVAALPAAEAATPKRRPNVLYVFSDQHRAASLPGEPYSQIVAPNLDRFRRENLSMDMCVSNYPLCSPHRGILMTGKYPAQNGIEANNIAMRADEFTLTQAFKGAGYHTGYVGKWHLGPDQVPPPVGSPRRFGIDDWHIFGNTDAHYHSSTFDAAGKRITPVGWGPVVMTDQAIELMTSYKQKPETPWMLMVSWNPPHPPFDPPAEDQKPYSGTLKARPNIKLPAAGGAQHVPDEAAFHQIAQGYYGGITGIDLQFARVLKALDDLNLADNTIVVYTSDHGEMMGSQGKMAKQMPWDESCRVPFSIRWPGVTPKAKASDALFSSIDIYPTLCGLAGIPVPGHCMGHDISDVMRGKNGKALDVAFLLNGPGGTKAAPEKPGAKSLEQSATHYRGVRTATHTYTVSPDGRWLLYDNIADPYQMKNLAHDPAHKELMDGFDVKLRQWLQSTGDKFPFPANV